MQNIGSLKISETEVIKTKSHNHFSVVGVLLICILLVTGITMSMRFANHHALSQRTSKIKDNQINKYVLYKDFSNRESWVSQRRHGQFNGSVCEAATLLTALRLENLAKKTSLYRFTKNYIGYPSGNARTSPFTSYNRNPYLHHRAAVYSQPIAQAAKKAGSRAKVIDGTNSKTIIDYLKHGHPIYVEAGHQMDPIWHGRISDHTLVLAGIRKDRRSNIQIKYMDPNCNNYRTASAWCSLNKFLAVWRRPQITGERAVVLLGKSPKRIN